MVAGKIQAFKSVSIHHFADRFWRVPIMWSLDFKALGKLNRPAKTDAAQRSDIRSYCHDSHTRRHVRNVATACLHAPGLLAMDIPYNLHFNSSMYCFVALRADQFKTGPAREIVI